MIIWLLLFLGLNPKAEAIEWNYSTRLEGASAEETFSNRALIQTDISLKLDNVNFYIDGFAEVDGAPEKTLDWRRFENGAYLREGYVEFMSDGVYLKVGRQSARWSESWVVPSLDVWTSRRLERLYIEPLSYQLAHSSGAVLSIARPNWSLDVAAMWEVSRDTLPKPFPRYAEPLDNKMPSGGTRFKFDAGGFQTSFVAAKALQRATYGASTSYALDAAVPKVEIGTIENLEDDQDIKIRNMNFGSLGVDIFWDRWTITPQVTLFDGENPYVKTNTQAVYYLAVQFDSTYHNFQLQAYSNGEYEDNFGTVEYTYKFSNSWQLTGFVQNYYGLGANLTSAVYQQTGGTFFGARLQFNGSLFTRK